MTRKKMASSNCGPRAVMLLCFHLVVWGFSPLVGCDAETVRSHHDDERDGSTPDAADDEEVEDAGRESGDGGDVPAIDSCDGQGCAVKVELRCKDGVDDDGDGVTDGEDGDCWIREGAIFMEDFFPLRTFDELAGMSPELRQIGIKTIELVGIWEHPWANTLGSLSSDKRWEVRDFARLDPMRVKAGGNPEAELAAFLGAAHGNGLKVLGFLQTTYAVPASQDCKDRTALLPNGTRVYANYDGDGIGGHYYRHQIAHPEQEILLRNTSGDLACAATGFGFITNQDSEDFIRLIEELYSRYFVAVGLDGARLDSTYRNNCRAQDQFYLGCQLVSCPDPVAEVHSPLPLYRRLRQLKSPAHVFLAENAWSASAGVPEDTRYLCHYPYYPSEPDVDEAVEIAEGYEFALAVYDLLQRRASSADLVTWLEDQPIRYGRQRVRFIRNVNGDMRFVAGDPRYYSAVTLASTIPGVPEVTDYELNGNPWLDTVLWITVTNAPETRRAHWKRVLGVRNASNALIYGSIANVHRSGELVYAYVREHEGERAVVVASFADGPVTAVLDLSFLAEGTLLSDKLSGESVLVTIPGSVDVPIPAFGSRILVPTPDRGSAAVSK